MFQARLFLCGRGWIDLLLRDLLTRPTPRTPGRALAHASTALDLDPSKLARFTFLWTLMVKHCDLRWMHGPIAVSGGVDLGVYLTRPPAALKRGLAPSARNVPRISAHSSGVARLASNVRA